MTSPIRVLIVDDHEIVREGLDTLLSEEADIRVVGQAAGGAEALELAATCKPDVILMDIVMPEMDGIAATRRLLQVSRSSHILVLTSFLGDQRVRDAIQAGAIGYLLKDVTKFDLLRAIRTAATGKPILHAEAQRSLMRQAAPASERLPHEKLTEREFQVLRLIAQGQSNRSIATALNLTEGTVKVYVSVILGKLSVADRTQAALYAVQHGLARTEPRPD
ncbi:MAG: response regulator transcription factor [Chloroflexi bacterium]|nr:response regulator transcription factor [Chloroflexota bacterium]